MSKLFLQGDDVFTYFLFKKKEFYTFLDDDNMELSELEIVEEGVSNISEFSFKSDDTFIIGKANSKYDKIPIEQLSYGLDDTYYDYFNSVVIGYSKKLDITITMEHIEELHMFKGDPLNIMKFYESKTKKEKKN